MLSVSDLRIRLGQKDVLHGITLEALPGTVTCIVGPNGSGKTTTLRAMTGDVAYSGTVTLNDHTLKDLKPWEAAALRGVLPQASTLAFPFTVIEVVRIGLQAGTRGDDDQIAMQALARVDLEGYANRFYQELSGGEQQRVQLARVLAQIPAPVTKDGPRWLFLDEPVSSLDIAHQLQVMTIVSRFARAGGGAVAVMHDLNLSAMFADQIILLAEGCCVAAGSPKEVMRDDTLSRAYGCALRVCAPPPADVPYLLPHSAALAAE
ncbi:heme ABC transporter ATP-binding protein [Primorskyibacter sp. S187A]|uniref:heme ABC transporter ATP-binding protein n=1 Tax=Primorskyibacter sp. S187A TaxID=3415130 RepID=UPI003C7CA02E